MRGHWDSQTRKLNRHYQSGSGGGYSPDRPRLLGSAWIPGSASDNYELVHQITNISGQPWFTYPFNHLNFGVSMANAVSQNSKKIRVRYLFEKSGNFDAYIDYINIAITYRRISDSNTQSVRLIYYPGSTTPPQLNWVQYQGYVWYVTQSTLDEGEKIVYNNSEQIWSNETTLDFDIEQLSPYQGHAGIDYIVTLVATPLLEIGSTQCQQGDHLRGVMAVYRIG